MAKYTRAEQSLAGPSVLVGGRRAAPLTKDRERGVADIDATLQLPAGRAPGRRLTPVFDDRTFPGDGYYWCEATCTQVGPDDELCEPDKCLPGRACYEGLGAS